MDNKPTVQLIDGRAVSSWSDEWRVECMARAIARKPHLELRRAAMANWQKKMPAEEFSKFKRLVAEIYNRDRSNNH